MWYSPFPLNLDEDEMVDLLGRAAQRAARLSGRATVVFVAGGEVSIFARGFLPGDTMEERVAHLMAGRGRPADVNPFLRRAAEAVREHFDGPVTYAAIHLENVDWTPFDIVSYDAHRSAAVADIFPEAMRKLVAEHDPKPVAVTEVGCTTHRDAAAHGGQGGSMMFEYENEKPVRLNGDYVRDEGVQARYLREVLGILDEAGMDAAFVCTFVCHGFTHREDPRRDLDMAGWGIVKVLGTGEWEPKQAFHAVAGFYGAR